jgi:HK97 family phage major capsid protein
MRFVSASGGLIQGDAMGNSLKTKPTQLKFIKAEDNELVLDGPIVLWDGVDLDGQHFDTDTDFESSYTRTGRLLVDWEHGQEPDVDDEGKPIKQPGRDDLLGYVDRLTARKDDIGLLARHVLDRREVYVKEFIEPLAKAGMIATSSEAAIKGVKVLDTGKIRAWPLKRQSLTVWPAETRLFSDHQLQVVKSLATTYPHLKGVILEAEGQKNAQESVKDQATETTTDTGEQEATDKNLLQETIMSKEEGADTLYAERLDALDANQVKFAKSLDKVIDILEKEPSTNAAGTHIEVIKDEGDQPFKTFGGFLQAVRYAGTPNGQYDPRLAGKSAKATGLNETVGAQGGFLVSQDDAGMLVKEVYERSKVASRCRSIAIGPNSNGLTMNAVNETARATGSRWGGIQSYWLGEAGTKTASTISWRQLELKLRKLIGMMYATDELLQDTTALGNVIGEAFADDFAWMKDNAVYNGLGGFQPLGFMASGALVSVAKETGQAADTIVSANIHKMYSRRLGDAGAYVWFVNQDVEPQLFGLTLDVGTGGLPLYTPPGGINDAPYGNLMGRPVIPVEFAATVGTTGDIAFCDMQQYLLIDKGGVEQASSIHVNFVYDETVFRFVYRVDGRPVDAAPVTPANSALTQSPFVVLASRD